MSAVPSSPDSFVSAWSKANFPPENRAFVKWFTSELGISSFEFIPADYRYIRATRRDGAGELRIHWGCTTGFTEEEAQRFGSDSDEVRLATTQGVTWLVAHPVHRDVSLRGPNATANRPELKRCPRCSIYELSVTGRCPSCDED